MVGGLLHVAVRRPPLVLLQGIRWGPAHYCVASRTERASVEVLPVLRAGAGASAVGVLLRNVHVFPGQPSGTSGEERLLLSAELDASLLQVGRGACRPERWVIQGDIQSLLELMELCCTVCVADNPGEVLYVVSVVVGCVV